MVQTMEKPGVEVEDIDAESKDIFVGNSFFLYYFPMYLGQKR